MGKVSNLRNTTRSNETRQSYSNGDRKFYDRDACPAGADEYVWQLTLLFEQQLAEFGVDDSKRPIVYTELYEIISRDRDLTSLIEPGTLHTSGKGEGGKALVTSATKVHSKKELIVVINKYNLIATIIDRYFNSYDSNNKPSINNLISNFKLLKEEIIEEEYLKYLKTSGTRIPVVTTGRPQEDKRKKEVQETLDITVNRVYSEQDMEEMFTRFREGHK